MAGHGRSWLTGREGIVRSRESRQFVDDILAELAAGHYAPLAWATFIRRSVVRSVAQIRTRPLAAADVTALHLLAGIAGSWRWTSLSWFLSITHLGLLGDRATLGWPNRLTLLRALLPALGSRWTAAVAAATDFADGRLARGRQDESAFGAFADPMADAAFWSWYGLRWEPSRWLRWGPVAFFGLPAAVIAIAYFGRGRSIDYPRPMAYRYASGTMQALLTLRLLRSLVK